MKTKNATSHLSLRLTLAQKARLLQLADKAGDPNPSITVLRKLFGRSAAIGRVKRYTGPRPRVTRS